MHFQSHTVINLECHLQNQQRVTFIEGNKERALDPKDTKLMAWFVVSQRDPDARLLTYTEFLNTAHGRIVKSVGKTSKRQSQNCNTSKCCISQKVELFLLRLLILHIKIK